MPTWSSPRAAAAGFCLGCIVSLCVEGLYYFTRSYDLSEHTFLLTLAALVFGLPGAFFASCFRRVPNFDLGGVCSITGAFGFIVVSESARILKFGLWQAFSLPWRSATALILYRVALDVMTVSAVFLAWILMWAIIRAIHRFVWKEASPPGGHPVCASCGYDLFGIESNCCPECGSPTATDGQVLSKLTADR